MERLTTNKSVADMSMVELAHNSCYVDDECNARYRDYDMGTRFCKKSYGHIGRR